MADLNCSIAKVKEKFGFKIELKPEQLEIIKSVIEGKDVFGLLPTGFGKSMTYIFIPLVLDEVFLLSPAPYFLIRKCEVARTVMDAKYYFYF